MRLARNTLLIEMIPHEGESFRDYALRAHQDWHLLSPEEQSVAVAHLARMQDSDVRRQDSALGTRPPISPPSVEMAERANLIKRRAAQQLAAKKRRGSIASSATYRQPLLLELMTASSYGQPSLIGRTAAGGIPPSGVTSTANIGLRSRPHGYPILPGSVQQGDRLPIGGVIEGDRIARALRKRLGLHKERKSRKKGRHGKLSESVLAQAMNPSGLYTNYSFNLPSEDRVADYYEWRRQCPNYDKIWHGAFCKRCDETAFRTPIGGVEWLHGNGWRNKDPIGEKAWPSPSTGNARSSYGNPTDARRRLSR